MAPRKPRIRSSGTALTATGAGHLLVLQTNRKASAVVNIRARHWWGRIYWVRARPPTGQSRLRRRCDGCPASAGACRTSTDRPAAIRAVLHRRRHPCPDWDAVLRLFRPSQVVHLAAETGTAQSLSEATRHGSVNVVGTTQLLDALSRSAVVPGQLVLASSRAVYGEGAWQCGTRSIYPRPRSHAQLLAGMWDPKGPKGEPAVPLPSRAGQTEPRPTNIYAATKLAQEHMLKRPGRPRTTPISVCCVCRTSTDRANR